MKINGFIIHKKIMKNSLVTIDFILNEVLIL